MQDSPERQKTPHAVDRGREHGGNVKSLHLVLLATSLTLPATAQREPWEISREALLRDIEAGLAAGARHRNGLESPAEVTAWQRRIRDFLEERLGEFVGAHRAPPDVITVRTLPRDGYRIEHLLIEAFDRSWIPAHRYVPDAARFPAPRPAVLVACGHSEEGKSYPLYQRGAATLAQHGFVALCFDPVEQGERLQEFDESGKALRWGTRAHNVQGARALLLGTSMAAVMVADAVRCVDALVRCDDVDAERLGICGNSGGGTQTVLAFAFDERLKVAAPSCYVTSLPQVLRAIGPQDAEQLLRGQATAGIDHADLLAVRAPAPTLVCAAQRDFFPIGGTRETVDEARKVYAALSASDHLALTEVDAGHGWDAKLIEATVEWFGRHLLDEDLDVTCVANAPMTATEAQVCEQGQVELHENAHPLPARLRDYAQVLRAQLHLDAELGEEPALAEARRLFGFRQGPIATRPIQSEHREDGVQWIRFADGTTAPSTRHKGEGRPVLVLGNVDLRSTPERPTTWLSPLCTGHAQPKEKAWYGSSGPAGRDAALGILLDRCLVAIQTRQILDVAAQLRASHGEAPDLVAHGPAGIAALHAAAFARSLFGEVEIETPIDSWLDLYEPDVDETLLPYVVPGALRHYDLRHLRAALER